MTAWINGTLDELDARLRELRRELAREGQALAWWGDPVSGPEDRGLGRVHDLDALRRQHARSKESEPFHGGQPARGAPLSRGVA